MNDDTIIKQRIGGRSVRAIAKTNGCSVAEVNQVLDLFANATITDQVRKHTMALELPRRLSRRPPRLDAGAGTEFDHVVRRQRRYVDLARLAGLDDVITQRRVTAPVDGVEDRQLVGAMR